MAFWLKRWGTSEDGYRDGMLTDHLSFGKSVLVKRIAVVREGDRLIVTGTKTRGALVAAATATSEVAETPGPSKWRWRCTASFQLKCPVVKAPKLTVIPDPDGAIRKWHRNRRGLHRITESQFRAAEAAIGAASSTAKR